MRQTRQAVHAIKPSISIDVYDCMPMFLTLKKLKKLHSCNRTAIITVHTVIIAVHTVIITVHTVIITAHLCVNGNAINYKEACMQRPSGHIKSKWKHKCFYVECFMEFLNYYQIQYP
jgi:hypothetical protein